jgi:hypothetical protein
MLAGVASPDEPTAESLQMLVALTETARQIGEERR